MRVTYFGATGQVRMVYHKVVDFSIKGSLVSLNSYIPAEFDTETGVVTRYGQYRTMAILSLAPGEYLEWSEDEPNRT